MADNERLSKFPGSVSNFLLLLLMVTGMIAGNLLSLTLWKFSGIDIQNILEGESLDHSSRIMFRIGLILNHVFIFFIPAFIFIKILGSKHIGDDLLSLKKNSKSSQIILWGLVILFSYPLIAQLSLWNELIPLPSWLSGSQDDAFAMLKQTLRMEGFDELFLSILLVGVFAALGEELIFRGIVQNQFIKRGINPHISIIISAFIFGGFHMQFERIIPLAFLGMILGYSYFYTKSIAVPILLHFANNTFQVLSVYFITRNGELPKIDEVPDLSFSLVVGSAVLTLILAIVAAKITPASK